MSTTTRRTIAALATAGAVAAILPFAAGTARADVPDKWEPRTSICTDSLSFYSENPALNPGVAATHVVAGHKKFYWTSAEIINGWEPVYSDGQNEWHTGWVRQECLANGFGYPDDGRVVS